MNRVAIFQLAYGKAYLDIFKEVYPFNRKYLFPDEKVDYVLFTDQKGYEQDGVIVVEVEEETWPYICLQKSLLAEEWLKKNNKYNYAYYVDVDNVVMSEMGKEWLKEFTLFLPSYWGAPYVGGFYGGKVENLLTLYSAMNKTCREWIDDCFLAEPHWDENLLARFIDSGIAAAIYRWGVHVEWQKCRPLSSIQLKDPVKIIQLNKDSNLCRNYDTEIRHPYWKDKCLINWKRGVFIRSVGDELDIAKLVKKNEEEYFLNWQKYPDTREILNVKSFEITYF